MPPEPQTSTILSGLGVRHTSALDRALRYDGRKKFLTPHNHITKIIDMNRDYMRAIPSEWKSISRVFTALGDEHRQRILLTFEKGERLNVGQIVEVSTLSRSAVSHHLKILRESGVLDSRKEGKEVFFWINRAQLEESMTAVLDYVRNNA